MKKNESAFETNTEGSAFETNTNGSAFETNTNGSAFETSGFTGKASGAQPPQGSQDGNTFVLTDNMNVSYTLRDEVELKSQGAMGRVSTAIWIDGKSEKKVLLKRRYKPVDPNEERLFSNEGSLSRDYGGGNVVKTYAKGETDKFLFMIMEFYDGQTLDKMIEEGAYQGRIDASVKLVRGILSGLADLHSSEIVHRDLKPANIMVRKNGAPVILDLGLARQVSISDVSGLSKIGTPKYAAPEQLRGEFSCASDIYSLGKIFLEMFTGSLKKEALAKIPETYREFVEKCLKDDPEERYANATEAREALEDLNMMGRSTVVVTANVDKLRIEIAKKYGDDGELDEQELQELRSMAKMWNISEEDLDVFIDAAFNDIMKFRRNNIVGCILQKKGYSKQAVMERAKKLHIEPQVVEQWLEETPEKLAELATAYAEDDEETFKAVLEEVPVNVNWIDAIQEMFYEEDEEEDDEDEEEYTPAPKANPFQEPGDTEEKKGCGSGCGSGCGTIIFIWIIYKVVQAVFF